MNKPTRNKAGSAIAPHKDQKTSKNKANDPNHRALAVKKKVLTENKTTQNSPKQHRAKRKPKGKISERTSKAR
jgi:hypothetical protein